MNTDYGAGESADDSDGRAEDPARHAGDTGRRAENQPGYADGYREIVDYGCEYHMQRLVRKSVESWPRMIKTRKGAHKSTSGCTMKCKTQSIFTALRHLRF
jgi:hypothetical protein